MGPKEYAAFQAQQRLEGQKQAGENQRTDKRISADITTSREANKAAMDREVFRARKDIEIANMKGKDVEGCDRQTATGHHVSLWQRSKHHNPASYSTQITTARIRWTNWNRARNLYETGKVRTLEEAAAAAVREIISITLLNR